MCDMLCNSKTRCKKKLGNLLKELNNNYGPSEHKSYNKESPAAESLRVRKGEEAKKDASHANYDKIWNSNIIHRATVTKLLRVNHECIEN